MRRITTNALNNKNVCTYMEELLAQHDKINEIIDLINHSNYSKLYKYNFFISDGDNLKLVFEIYSHQDVDHDSLEEFFSNFNTNIRTLCNGYISAHEQGMYITWEKGDEIFGVEGLDGTSMDVGFNELTNVIITQVEV